MSTYAKRWKDLNKQQRMLAGILTVLAVSLLITIAFLFWPAAIRTRLIKNDDVFKLTYQFVLIVVIGGLLSLLYSRFEHERNELAKAKERDAAAREAERALRSQTFNDVIKAYNAAKKVRRLLRATAIECTQDKKELIIHQKPFSEQMEALVSTQLDFEALKHRAKNINLFPIENKLEYYLEFMEKYLGKIVKDYEQYNSAFNKQSATQPLSSLKYLTEFVREFEENGPFDEQFKQPFHRVLDALQKLIIMNTPDA